MKIMLFFVYLICYRNGCWTVIKSCLTYSAKINRVLYFEAFVNKRHEQASRNIIDLLEFYMILNIYLLRQLIAYILSTGLSGIAVLFSFVLIDILRRIIILWGFYR